MKHPRAARLTALLAPLVLWESVPVRAATTPAPPLEARVLAVFERHCAECHGPGKDETPVLSGGVSLAELRNNAEAVVPGKPEQSELLRRVTLPPDDRKRMPKAGRPGTPDYREPLAEADVAAIRQWIAGDATLAARPFLAETNILQLALKDLRDRPAGDRPHLRYLSLHNLHNLPPALEPARNLDVYRIGVAKLLNSLSWETALASPAAIDPHQVVLRLDLRHYGWTADMWRTVVRHYPYARPHETLDAEISRLAATTDHVVVRADWFVFAAAQPPLYDQLLYGAKVPKILSDPARAERHLEDYLGVDVAARLRQAAEQGSGGLRNLLFGDSPVTEPAAVLRAGFKKSGVSLNANRLIERHALPDGRAYWKSYDFADNDPTRGHDLFLRPLGPPGSGLSERDRFAFRHDGGELIFHLPNGLQGYLLTTADGRPLRRAPPNIVQDRTRRDGHILNGISCIKCHDQGMKEPPNGLADDIREGALTALQGATTEAERRAIRNLYADNARLGQAVGADRARFQQALKTLGADRFAEEPVAFLYYAFLRDINEEMLAAELDLDRGALRMGLAQALRESADELVRARAAQVGRGFQRREFIPLFAALVREIWKSGPRGFTPLDYEEFNDGTAPPAVAASVPAAPAAASPRPPSAARFTNSLGMVFVPVPGTEVLFSVWETRVQDYAAFAAANPGGDMSWKDPVFGGVPVTPGPTHPVVNVRWEDAKGFCAWLTRHERAAGRLDPTQEYRLPTDAEWSWAVGIGDREGGGTPKDKDEKLAGVYPWGTQWPPPAGAGNFADETAKARFPDWTIIPGYRDGFATTAPVGSFPANRVGLHDLSGNVWEWCEDWYDGEQKYRVLRGGSWLFNDPRLLLASFRRNFGPGGRINIVGFRCVVVGVGAAR